MTWSAEELHGCVHRVEELLQRLARYADDPAEPAGRVGNDAVQALVDLYGEALARVVAVAAEAGVTGRLAEDELLSHLLLVHDLHPEDAGERIGRALEEIRPQLKARGADAELAEVSGGVARLRIDVRGCASTGERIVAEVGELISTVAPEVEKVEALPARTEPVLVTVADLLHASAGRES